MEALEAHRERVAQLRELLDRLVGVHRRLYELRSESWHEQEQGDLDRSEMLVQLHAQIDELEGEAEMMRESLRALIKEGSADSASEEDDTVPVPSA